MQIVAIFVALTISAISWAEGHHPDLKEFTVSEIKPSMYMLQGKGGNIFVLKSNNELLVIDDDYAENSSLLKQTLDDMGTTQYLINTHWHGDHTGGNKVLGAQSTIIAHDNVRKRLASPQQIQLFNMKTKAQPEVALPAITYDNTLSLHFGGQLIKVHHYPTGHTDGDSIVFIQPANLVHMGDHFFNGIFPFVDVENGGDVKGMAANVAEALQLMDDKTIVVPGHGPLANKKQLQDFHTMLQQTTAFVERALASGQTLEKIQEQGLPEKWEAWGKGFLNEAAWIGIIASSLNK